jgi:tyrosine-protein phosphatase SIW14
MQARLSRPLGVFLFSLTLTAGAQAANPIPNFVNVEPGLYRGGTPGAAGIAELQALGVRTIVNLDDRSGPNREELAEATAAGIREIQVPMSGFFAPSNARANRALAALEDPSLRPVFVHCAHGQDRTGLIMGLYRVEAEKWAPAQAYAEMLQLGFHPLLFPLNHYFEERTGFED